MISSEPGWKVNQDIVVWLVVFPLWKSVPGEEQQWKFPLMESKRERQREREDERGRENVGDQ